PVGAATRAAPAARASSSRRPLQFHKSSTLDAHEERRALDGAAPHADDARRTPHALQVRDLARDLARVVGTLLDGREDQERGIVAETGERMIEGAAVARLVGGDEVLPRDRRIRADQRRRRDHALRYTRRQRLQQRLTRPRLATEDLHIAEPIIGELGRELRDLALRRRDEER